MSNQHRQTVNQRLYFARLHLQWLQRELDSAELPAAIAGQALGESLLFHLRRAYQAYLLEIAESYGLFPARLDNARAFTDLLNESGKMSAQANELLELEASPGWLSAMLASSIDVLLPAHSPPTRDRIAHIQLADGDNEEPAGGSLLAIGQAGLENLAALIETQRGQLEEW